MIKIIKIFLHLLYVIWPLDIIPDVIPILGWIDDAHAIFKIIELVSDLFDDLSDMLGSVAGFFQFLFKMFIILIAIAGSLVVLYFVYRFIANRFDISLPFFE